MNGLLDEAGIALALMLLFDILKSAPPFGEGSSARRYIPHIAMLAGIGIYVAMAATDVMLSGRVLLEALISGIIAGAAATGFHETGVPERVYRTLVNR